MGGAFGAFERHDRCLKGYGGETWGKETTWKTESRWEDNIKTDLQEVELITNWIDLAQDRDKWRAFVNALMKFQVQ